MLKTRLNRVKLNVTPLYVRQSQHNGLQDLFFCGIYIKRNGIWKTENDSNQPFVLFPFGFSVSVRCCSQPLSIVSCSTNQTWQRHWNNVRRKFAMLSMMPSSWKTPSCVKKHACRTHPQTYFVCVHVKAAWVFGPDRVQGAEMSSSRVQMTHSEHPRLWTQPQTKKDRVWSLFAEATTLKILQ